MNPPVDGGTEPANGGLPADVAALLLEVFAHRSLRGGQGRAIDCILNGTDVVVVLPTGAGKSLCYQLPAVHLARQGRGATLVVSPLIALMEDQVGALKQRGIAAAALHSQVDYLDQRRIHAQLMTGKLELLYVSPERVAGEGFARLLAAHKDRLALLAIDEAHCISRWGHDFRPEYRQLARLRTLLGSPPTIALTATATAAVRADIRTNLGMRAPQLVVGDFRRKNLQFRVFALRREQERLDALRLCLEEVREQERGGRAIVYCSSRKLVDKVASWLRKNGFAGKVAHYHAGRSNSARQAAHQRYEQGGQPILVATNAFGMGIDHANVRAVIHFQTPGSVEAYYQEAGRAGRDGRASQCLLFFGKQDLVLQERLMAAAHHSLLDGIEAYARNNGCRQSFLEHYFLGPSPTDAQTDSGNDAATGTPLPTTECGNCDHCLGQATAIPVDQRGGDAGALSGEELQVVVRCVGGLRRPSGKTAIAKGLRGSRAKALNRSGIIDSAEHGQLHHHAEPDIVAAIEELIQRGDLVRRGKKYPTVWLADKAIRRPRLEGESSAGARRPPRGSPLRRALNNYRQRRARSLKWKPYMVFHRQVIDAIDKHRPQSLWELEQMPGLGPAKIARFGDELLLLIQEHSP